MEDGPSRGNLARGLRIGDDRGAASIEFALIAVPFLFLLFMIFEEGLLFFKSEALQTAISDSARLIATGQASAATYTGDQFRQQVCSRLPPLLSCSSISIDVRTYSSFSSAVPFRPYDANGTYKPGSTIYSPGVQGSIVVITGFSLQHAMFPMLNAFFGKAGSGQILLSATAAFRNEPY